MIYKFAPFFSLRITSFVTRFFVFACLIGAILILGFANSALAAPKKSKSSKSTENPLYAAIVVDAQTGEVLMARQADSTRHPASLTKMMTLYMTFEAVQSGRLSMGDRVFISTRASKQSPSKLGLPAGSSILVEDAIKSLVTKSANDISVALGEKLAGSERAFASKMTRRARDLGLSRTTFRNASGLPDPQQVTTARDMAKLAMALLRDYPQYYHYFGVKNFEYRGASHHNHNRLLGEYPGLDGIKTGYINASGFNLVASAKQNGRRLVGVVFGGRSWRSRNAHMVKLLDDGFLMVKGRRAPIQEASITTTVTTVARAPIPLPPPMMEDVRGVDPMLTTRADETDSAEDGATYTPRDAQQIDAMIDRVQQDDVTQTTTVTTTTASITPAMMNPSIQAPTALDVPAAPAPAAPIPAARPPVPVPNSPVVSQITTTTTAKAITPPANAARTVMQLRIPRDQLPKGVPQNQIVRTSSAHGWAIQVGAFPSRAMTDQALRTAQSRLPSNLQQGQPVIVPQSTGTGVIFRGRLQGYDEIKANAACAHLDSCLVVAPGS